MNKVFIATSLDGYIADKAGKIDWLHSIPNPTNDNMGYNEFIESIDGIVMGRITFETVCNFDIDWPYSVPVFVLSNSLKEIPKKYSPYVHLINGTIVQINDQLHSQGFKRLYIDGGTTIQSFLNEDLIDEITITTIPVLLGGGYPLFGSLTYPLYFKHVKSEGYLDCIVQNTYKRIRI